MQKINTILFDLDGTLIDSNELIVDSFRETYRHYLPERSFTIEELFEMVGPPLKETFKIVSEDPEIIQEMIQVYRNYYIQNEFDYVKLFPNVLEVLKTLKEKNFNLGIVTTKYSGSAMPAIKHFGLDQYINAYSFLDNVVNHKPHAEPVLYALSQCKDVDMAIMVGDNSSDILSGKNAGILTCSVNWSIKKEELEKLDPTYQIDDFNDLIEIVNKYNLEE